MSDNFKDTFKLHKCVCVCFGEGREHNWTLDRNSRSANLFFIVKLFDDTYPLHAACSATA